MRKLLFFIAVISGVLFFQACDKSEVPDAGFKDMERLSIYDYIVENDSLFSKYQQVLVAAGLDKTMSAYNPNGDGYTMFLPTNAAIDEFVATNDRYSSFDDMLKDKDFLGSLVRYSVVEAAILTNDFPFGALPEFNLSGQYLMIGFDGGIYSVNNEAPVSDELKNIEVSNGYIHVIDKVLTPLVYTTAEWLEGSSQFSIFNQAVKATGYGNVLNRIIEGDTVTVSSLTLLVEPDSIYNRFGIFSFEDLAKKISPDNNEYTSPLNSLNSFVGYHILEGSLFLSNFEETSSNYNSLGTMPVNINGNGLDIVINKGKVVFDTLVSSGQDTTLVDYITFFYDNSNFLTQTGVVHFINQLMTPQTARAAEQWFEFFEEPVFNQYRAEGGSFLIEDNSLLTTVSWTGGNDQLLFVKSEDEEEQAWNDDFIHMEGDFSVSYTLPRIVQGSYWLYIRANAFNVDNALIEVFFDGVKVGGLIDLTTGGNAQYPYVEFELGEVTLLDYKPHVITVTSLIPGYFDWDYVYFRPTYLEKK